MSRRRYIATVDLVAALTLMLMLTLMLAALPAAAQSLVDPTRPPPEARLTAVANEAPLPKAGPRLQSVLIGTRGREVAVIDGQTVRKGETFEGAVLVEVRKNQVVLQHGRVRQVLNLFPDAAPKR